MKIYLSVVHHVLVSVQKHLLPYSILLYTKNSCEHKNIYIVRKQYYTERLEGREPYAQTYRSWKEKVYSMSALWKTFYSQPTYCTHFRNQVSIFFKIQTALLNKKNERDRKKSCSPRKCRERTIHINLPTTQYITLLPLITCFLALPIWAS